MCLLSARDRRQLNANLWRTKSVLKREPGRIRASFFHPVTFLSIVMILNYTVFHSVEEQIMPFEADDWTVTSSGTPAISTWPEDSTLKSNFSLSNCTINS